MGLYLRPGRAAVLGVVVVCCWAVGNIDFVCDVLFLLGGGIVVPLKTVSRMNAIEEEFAWMLEQRKRAGEIVDYAFEAMTFRLADRTTYTPDFVIVHPDHFELVDVKARGVAKMVRSKSGKVYKKQWTSKRDDAAVKMKVAADRFPWMRWAYYYHEADGRWTREDV